MILAQEPDCALGGLLLSPSRGTLSDGITEQRVAPLLMQVLLVLVRADGATVTRDDLAQACWDGRIVSDDAINRVIAQLRHLGRRFAPPPYDILTVPKVGFRLEAAPPPAPTAKAPTTPPQMDLAATPAGPRTRRPAGRWIALSAIILGAVLGAGWFVGRALLGPPSSRVEVAPFQALRAADADSLRVSRATQGALVRVLRGADIPVVESSPAHTGAAADADFHLRGAVDRDGDAMIVTAQLLDRSGRNVLWSGRLERSLAALDRFPEQAANQVGDTLHCALKSRATSNHRMTDAVLSLMLQACELRRTGPDEIPKFLAAAERVRAVAPRLSAAQSIYALAAADQAVMSTDPRQAGALAAAARSAAHRALELDPRNGEAYFAIGLSYGFDGAWVEREANFRRAEALAQGFNVVRDLHVGLLREVGRLREARELNRRALADDPFSVDQLSTLIILTAVAEGPEAAKPLLQRLRTLAPPEQAEDVRFTTDFWWGEPKSAAARLAQRDDDRACFRDFLAGLEGPAPHRGLPDSCRRLQADWRIRMLAREGDLDGAYREIGQAQRGSSLLIALYYAEMRAFRADPRFMPLAARYGLVDYWIRSGRWPDFCADPELPYDCRAAAAAATAALSRPGVAPIAAPKSVP